MIKISVVIVAYKNGAVLQQTLNSIHDYNDIGNELEVIVVDNSPICENVEKYVLESKCNNVKYIKAENKGFGTSNNTGASNASGDILAFINPDIIFIEPIFSYIYSYFLENINAVWVGCKLLDQKLNNNYSFFNDFESSFFDKITLDKNIKRDRYIDSSMCLSGSNIFIKRKIFEKVGRFDENIFMYCEEYDLKRRIQSLDKNYQIVYLPNLKLIHLEGRNICSSSFSYRLKRELEACYYIANKYNLNFKKKLNYYIHLFALKYIYFFLFDRDKFAINKDAFQICMEFRRNLK